MSDQSALAVNFAVGYLWPVLEYSTHGLVVARSNFAFGNEVDHGF